jgi:hypothetical protein
MKELAYYLDWSNKKEDIQKVLLSLFVTIPCFIQVEYIEMNWVKVIVKCRQEDCNTAEQFIADLVS